MTLSEMKALLAAGDIRLTRSLGQNFLHDGNQLRRIVEAGDLSSDDPVLEVGPGLGPLTHLLVERAGSVLAIEKDRRLFDLLVKRFADRPSLTLLHDDALEFLQREPRDWTNWKLVANLPYSAASPILVELAGAAGCPKRMVATLQLEVARRIQALPGTPDYGLLTVLLQLRYEPRGFFRIPPSCFHPEPDVDSACVVLVRRSEPLLDGDQFPLFRRIVRRAFSQRRKMMLKLLKQDWPAARLESAFAALRMDPKVRAERLSTEQFADLTRHLAT